MENLSNSETKHTANWRESEDWKTIVSVDIDFYGGATVKVAERVMEILDTEDIPFEWLLPKNKHSTRINLSGRHRY